MTPLLPPEDTSILVVDDNQLNLELLKQDLGDAGYQVTALRSGQEALTYISLHVPDLMLLDIMMPGMSGLEVLSRLRERPDTRNLPIILVTAKTESRDIVEGLNAGANDYVTKPIDLDVLVARIRTHLRLRALQDELEESNDRMRRELQEARRVQLSLMPSPETLGTVQSTHGLRICSFNQPAEALGGDFWDVMNLADGSVGLLVADFAGRGVIPAFNTFRMKTFLHTSCAGISNCGLVLARINALLVRDLPRNDYATCLYVQYSHDLRCMAFANAGHSPPLIFRKAARKVEILPPGGHPAGLFPDADFAEARESLSPGDVILLHTDGLVNQPDDEGKPFGIERLERTFREGAAGGAQEAHQALFEALGEFTGSGAPADDITFVVIEVLD